MLRLTALIMLTLLLRAWIALHLFFGESFVFERSYSRVEGNTSDSGQSRRILNTFHCRITRQRLHLHRFEAANA